MANWKPAPVPEDQQEVQQGPKSDLSELGTTGDVVAWGVIGAIMVVVVISVLRWLLRERGGNEVEQDDPLLRR